MIFLAFSTLVAYRRTTGNAESDDYPSGPDMFILQEAVRKKLWYYEDFEPLFEEISSVDEMYDFVIGRLIPVSMGGSEAPDVLIRGLRIRQVRL